jgi:hypothetical protein
MRRGFVRTMVRMSAGSIDMAQRAASRHCRKRCIDQGYEPDNKTGTA